MSRHLLRVLAFLAAVVVLGTACAPQTQSQTSGTLLRNYPKVSFVFNNTNVGSAISGGGLGGSGGIAFGGTTQSTGGAAEQAALDLAFELEMIGFTLVGDNDAADAVVEFSIGSVRFDAIAGWIADQAIVRFRDRRSGNVVAGYRVGTTFITPTTRSLVVSIARQIQRDW